MIQPLLDITCHLVVTETECHQQKGSYNAPLSSDKGGRMELVTGFSGVKSYAPSPSSQRFPLICFHMECWGSSLFGDSLIMGARQLAWCLCTTQKTPSSQRETAIVCVWSFTFWVSSIPVVTFRCLAHLSIPVFLLLLLFLGWGRGTHYTHHHHCLLSGILRNP